MKMFEALIAFELPIKRYFILNVNISAILTSGELVVYRVVYISETKVIIEILFPHHKKEVSMTYEHELANERTSGGTHRDTLNQAQKGGLYDERTNASERTNTSKQASE